MAGGRAARFLFTLAGLMLLSVLGFAGGLLGRVAWEEPDLVLGYLTGRTREVSLSGPAPAEPEPLPEVAAAPRAEEPPLGEGAAPAREGRGAQPPAPGPPAAAPRTPRPTIPTALRSGAAAPRLAVQVGAFTERASADSLADALSRKGFAAYVTPGEGRGARWRVRVGPLRSREEAERTAARLKREERLPTWVLSEN